MFRQLAFISLLLIQSRHWSFAKATIPRNPDDVLEEYPIDKVKHEENYQDYPPQEPKEHTIYNSDTGNGKEDGIAKEAQAPGEGQGAGPSPEPTNNSHPTHLAPQPQVQGPSSQKEPAVLGNDLIFIGVVTACSVAGLIGIIMAGVCWYKLHQSAKAASEVDYPAYGVTGPTKDRLPSPGDRKLAQSAQMYHYQHQKQQMIAMEKANGEMKHDASDEESEEENEEGDYTVYECPGLAPTGEMEVKNPLFTDETPVTPSADDRHDIN